MVIQNFDIKNISPKSNEVQHILDSIKEFGFIRICEFVDLDRLEVLQKEFEYGLSFNNYKYGYGKMARFDKLDKKLSSIKKFFDEPFFKAIIQEFWSEFPEITNEYSFVHDYKYDDTTIYGHLHFDRRHQLKFMLYLTDVHTINYGAFSAIPKSNYLGKRLYEGSWKKALNIETANYDEIDRLARLVPDDDYRYRAIPLLVTENDLNLNKCSLHKVIPLTGEAGTLIIFDTHVLHRGGVVQENFERKVLRLHSFPKQ